MKRFVPTSMHWLLVVVLALAVTACASIGRPTGGKKDEIPPEFVSSQPAVGALNVNKQKIDLYFNENVQLKDAFNKVIVSPVQKNNPQVSANGRHVSIELKDTLLPNATYTIDFADAIQDLNEGNILDGFTTYFSTSDTIDTLRISGMVFEARTLEPAQGMLVGVYSNPADTAIHTMPLERIARTNQLGQFTIYNLKPGNYKVYALNDINRDYYWDRTEDVAFYDSLISPYVQQIQVTDTLRAWDNSDSLSVRNGTAYYPNDIVLTWFNEGYKAQYLKDYQRQSRRLITLNMAAKADSLPEITIANGPGEGRSIREWALLHASPTLDTLQYWIKDTTVLNRDSLYLSVKYQRTDTAEALVWKTDTLKFFWKDPKPKKKSKKEQEADTLPPQPTFMNFKQITSSQHEIYMPLVFEADQPIDTIAADGVKLEMRIDTIWEAVPNVAFEVDSMYPLTRRRMNVDWEEGQKYRLIVDSAAVVGLYGEWNNTVKHEFTLKKSEDYANLSFNIAGIDSGAVVEVLDKSDKVLATAPVINGQAFIPHLAPATVYARLFVDANGNGEWDTGNLRDSIQPEDVFYYPKKIVLKKNWDVSQTWDIYETPLELQKPWDIRKNKPKLKKGEKAPGQTDEDMDEEDEFGGMGGYGRQNTGRGTTNSTNRGTGGMGGMGGLRNMGGMLR